MKKNYYRTHISTLFVMVQKMSYDHRLVFE